MEMTKVDKNQTEYKYEYDLVPFWEDESHWRFLHR